MLRLGIVFLIWALIAAAQALFSLEGPLWEAFTILLGLGISFILPEKWLKSLKWYWKIVGMAVSLVLIIAATLVVSYGLAISPFCATALIFAALGILLVGVHFVRIVFFPAKARKSSLLSAPYGKVGKV